MIILDTNVASALMRPEHNVAVQVWLMVQPEAQLHITSITMAEMLYGASILPAGMRRDRMLTALVGYCTEDFGGRVLPFDDMAAGEFAAIMAMRRQQGRPMAQMDGQIAAIARLHGATLATRNIRDFEGCGIDLVDPWQA